MAESSSEAQAAERLGDLLKKLEGALACLSDGLPGASGAPRGGDYWAAVEAAGEAVVDLVHWPVEVAYGPWGKSEAAAFRECVPGLLASAHQACDAIGRSLEQETGRDGDATARLLVHSRGVFFWLQVVVSALCPELATAQRDLAEQSESFADDDPGTALLVLFVPFLLYGTYAEGETFRGPYIHFEDTSLRQAALRYLGKPRSATGVEVLLQFARAARETRGDGYVAADLLFEAASRSAPSDIEPILERLLTQCAWTIDSLSEDATYVNSGETPPAAETEKLFHVLRGLADDKDAVDRWREGHPNRAGEDPVLWAATGMVHLVGASVQGGFLPKTLLNEPRVFNSPWYGDPGAEDGTGDPHAWTRMLYRILAPVEALDDSMTPQARATVERGFRDVRDGLASIHRLVELGVNLGAKEVTFGELVGFIATPTNQARDRAVLDLYQEASIDLSGQLGESWKLLPEDVRKQLASAEVFWRAMEPSRSGSPTAPAQLYLGALEATLHEALALGRRRLALGDLAKRLPGVARVTNRFDVDPTDDQPLWDVVQTDPLFWGKQVPTFLGSGITELRNGTAHGGRATWEEAERWRSDLLGASEAPGWLARLVLGGPGHRAH